MSTRSPKNKRTQSREHSTGAARRSAASAKPARAAAGSVRIAPASSKARRKQREQGESLQGLSRQEKRARRQEQRIEEDRIYDASTILMKRDVEYQKRRRRFWIAVATAAVLFVVLEIALFSLRSSGAVSAAIMQYVGFGVPYALILGAMIYDIVRIKPLRKFYQAQAQGLSDRKLTALLEDAARQQDAGRATRKFRLPFFNGKSVDKSDSGASAHEEAVSAPAGTQAQGSPSASTGNGAKRSSRHRRRNKGTH